MYTTLDHLETLAYKRKHVQRGGGFWREIMVFAVIIAVVSLGMLIFTNARLFYASFQENVLGNQTVSSEQSVHTWTVKNAVQSTTIADSIAVNDAHTMRVNQLLAQYTQQGAMEKLYADDMHSVLEKAYPTYSMHFNTLPPTNRLIIPSLDIDIPIVDAAQKYMGDFIAGNFDDELQRGVVKYPTTPEPGGVGNTLIFGHTSQERRQKNPYGMIFSQIPRLQQGDMIQIIRKGQLYEYRVVEKSIQKVKNVNAEYLKYHNKGGSYITLMGCYPIGTTRDRIMVMAERIYSSIQ